MFKALIDTSVILMILVKDDEIKRKTIERFIKNAKHQDITLYLLPVAILEIVWVLEKVYKFEKKLIREHVEAILNTPEFKCEMEDVFKRAIRTYEEKNIKFADAVMAYWGLEKGISTVYTYDERDYKRIEGLDVKKPS